MGNLKIENAAAVFNFDFLYLTSMDKRRPTMRRYGESRARPLTNAVKPGLGSTTFLSCWPQNGRIENDPPRQQGTPVAAIGAPVTKTGRVGSNSRSRRFAQNERDLAAG